MPILYEKRDTIGIVTISEPDARNAWSIGFHEDLYHLFEEMTADRDIRCAILTGDERGGAFSAGANLKDPEIHGLPSAADFIESLPNARRLAFATPTEFPKPVIAAVNGLAVGIGCALTYACDLIIASERAEWRLPQASLGLLPKYGGSVRLARWIGKGMAMRLALGFPITAEDAYRTGLAQWLVPHGQLMDETMRVADRIARMPPLATRLVKESLNRGLDIPNQADAAFVDLYRFMALERSEDATESHAAWREKRHPVIKGQ